MIKKNKVAIIKDPNCLNCGYPFSHDEKFCPECGQKNRGKKITLGNFLKEIFAGFLSWDAKFWRTLIPLLIRPGKVSKDYIEGKRSRYTNPFRFYLATSIIFFLIINATSKYSEFNRLQNGGESDDVTLIKAIKSAMDEDIKKDSIKTDSQATKTIQKDSIVASPSLVTKEKNSYFAFGSRKVRFKEMCQFQEKHPNLSIDNALDSLKIEKTFFNRFTYSRTPLINGFLTDKGVFKKLTDQLLSYSSISLFILLPLFTVFLKLFYIRRKYTYVEHLVFVFHIQTVFFLLFSVFYIIDFFKSADDFLNVFLLLFMIYLFIAMKKFYQQGYFKTFIKYMLANIVFFILGVFGAIIIALSAFALY
ncbi:DUF3667 domain-containing protein [Tenacibaculum caenipelagi]|uniref:Uncharacterized protein DUF3667 n=1 Tax=Tenacibaculum caenipelagi TaxID=1325435 RepID=A0A4R6TF27_9FLAO|nr:DUF3667 domain-containing protein [Tenacibaculum caenipelagi]TDQ28393.1 uncharacterized protein DUF3667 [Tenacibaculum caenipelagi]